MRDGWQQHEREPGGDGALGAAAREPAGDALVFEALVKEFRVGMRGHLRALDRVTLQIGRGEIFGLLGPNGSGKTTLIKTALGLLRPTAGGGRLLGRPLGDRRARARIGYQPEQPYLYPFLTVDETLDFLGQLSRIPGARLAEARRRVVGQCGLETVLRTQVRHLSRGWLQRLALAAALLPDPDLLLLDEPLSGLDPEARVMVRRLIRSLRGAGRTILINTHYLPDIEQLADRVGLLRKGKLIACGEIGELLGTQVGAWEFELRGRARPTWLERGSIIWERAAEDRLLWRVTGLGDRERDALLGDILASGLQLIAMNPVRENLESCFTRLVGRHAAALEDDRRGSHAA